MSERTGIEWTDATFNPWWGCFPVSPGCALCYAKGLADFYGHKGHWEREGPRRVFGEKHWNEPRTWAKKLPALLGRRPRVFTASMADIGDAHPVCEQERPKLWRLIEETPELDWLCLTKRVDTAPQWLPAHWMSDGLPPHVWFGFSAEDQQRFDERWPLAQLIPARVIFCSYEPALGPVDFSAALVPVYTTCTPPATDEVARALLAVAVAGSRRLGARFLDWVIAGGESGRQQVRVPHPDWFRSARDQCAAAGVPFFFKQWGEWAPLEGTGACGPTPIRFWRDGRWHDGFTTARTAHMVRLGKRAAGHLLDGRVYQEFPT